MNENDILVHYGVLGMKWGGSGVKLLSDMGRKDLAQLAAYTSIGANALNAILYVKTSSENKKLRAYYGH